MRSCTVAARWGWVYACCNRRAVPQTHSHCPQHPHMPVLTSPFCWVTDEWSLKPHWTKLCTVTETLSLSMSPFTTTATRLSVGSRYSNHFCKFERVFSCLNTNCLKCQPQSEVKTTSSGVSSWLFIQEIIQFICWDASPAAQIRTVWALYILGTFNLLSLNNEG